MKSFSFQKNHQKLYILYNIYKSKEPFIKLSDLRKELETLKKLVNENNLKKIYAKLPEIITEYSPKELIVDYTYVKKKDSNS